jgi:hypothetical protein
MINITQKEAPCYIKLMSFTQSSQDSNNALELDPHLLRDFQRKATCQMMIKEYH